MNTGPRHRSTSGTRRKPRVLIVEDHEDTRQLHAWCLAAAGWQVDLVANGAEALAFAAAYEPDVIVMDLHMPVLDGIQATRKLKADARTANIPVVACTAFGGGREDELFAGGFVGLIPKPCTPEDVREALLRVLDRRDREAG